jgi:hypothetical protein
MATNTASGRTVFVLGLDVQGNRQAVVVESGDTYDIDPAAIVTYSSANAQFPYELV